MRLQIDPRQAVEKQPPADFKVLACDKVVQMGVLILYQKNCKLISFAQV